MAPTNGGPPSVRRTGPTRGAAPVRRLAHAAALVVLAALTLSGATAEPPHGAEVSVQLLAAGPAGSAPATGPPGQGGTPPGQSGIPGQSGPLPQHDFGVTAVGVTGLHPGAVRPLTLVVHNPYQFDIALTRVAGAVVGTSDPRCTATADNLVLGAYAGPPALPVTVGPSLRRSIGVLPVRMPSTVAQGCQGATFLLRLTAVATKVKR